MIKIKTTLSLTAGACMAFLFGFSSIADPAQAANGGVVYTYDALGRVTSASYDTNVIVYYTYDANGNRTAQVVNVNSATLQWTATVTPCTGNCWGATLW
jgi:YD repeat-containing protein